MASVSIQKIRRPEATPLARGSGGGREDRIRPERELFRPLAELTETNHELQMRVSAPGLDAENVRVTATPQWVLVEREKGILTLHAVRAGREEHKPVPKKKAAA